MTARIFALLLCFTFIACNKSKPDTETLKSQASSGHEAPPPEPKPIPATPSQAITTDSLKILFRKSKSLKEAIPTDRPAQAGASLLKYEDMFSESSMESGKLIERQFVEIDECGGDSIFTEYYRSGAISENSRSAIHFVGNFESGSHGIQSGMSQGDLLKALGTPTWSSEKAAIFSCPDPVEREHGNPDGVFECGWFYFDQGKLIGLTVNIQSDC